ncbi:hypothetical protein WDV85_00545 [Pseudokineococcus sp. 5B2Z-1]|uniref:hypothetical protein n=1 Tax=Pseudokineococcus sp. 5B2Z-1 TaxID=3132744 RepID=UPI002603EA20|nr:hypothetical protein [uncultured Pseudokineococcus sp.]
MVPTSLLVTAMIGGFAVALTAVLAVVGVLGSRLTDLRADMTGRFDGVDRRFDGVDRRVERLEERVGGVEEQMTAVRASLGAVDARLTTLER